MEETTFKHKLPKSNIILGDFEINYADLRNGLLAIRAINHPIRQDLIRIILEGKTISVTTLFIQLRLEQSVVSQHLAILRRVNILKTKRDGKNIYYSVNIEEIKRIIGYANDLLLEKKSLSVSETSIEFGDTDNAYNSLRVLAHDLRLKILNYIYGAKEINVNSIYNSLGLEQSITSQHLKLLRDEKYVKTRKEGKKIYYCLNIERIKQVTNAVNEYLENKT